MKRPRLRRWAKWVCTLAAVVCVGAAMFSRFYLVQHDARSSDGNFCWSFGVGSGLLWLERGDMRPFVNVRIDERWTAKRRGNWCWGLPGESTSPYRPSEWRLGTLYWHYLHNLGLGVSLVYPVLLTTLPAALLWYADRRRSGPHACKKCNYDRRGLPAGAKCPECGTVPTK